MYPTKVKEGEIENKAAIKCHLNNPKKKAIKIEFCMERENEEKVLYSVFIFQHSVKYILF